MSLEENHLPALRQLISDAEENRKRLGEAKWQDESAKREIQLNVWPWLEALGKAVHEELSSQDEAIQALIDDAEELLHPETFAKVCGILTMGSAIAEELERALTELGDDVRRKRATALIDTYRASMIELQQDLEAITPNVEELAAEEIGRQVAGDDEGDDDDGGEGDNEDEDGEGEVNA